MTLSNALSIALFLALQGCLWAGEAPTPKTALTANAPWPGLEGFMQARMLPGSDPELVEAFRNLYIDSPRFKALVERLWAEQTQIFFGLLPLKDEDLAKLPRIAGIQRPKAIPTFGSCLIQPIPQGYRIVLLVQTKLAKQGLDMPEPWMAQMVYALSEIAQRDSVTNLGQLMALDRAAQRKMWNFQRYLRGELKSAHPDRYRALARDGEYLYLTRLQ